MKKFAMLFCALTLPLLSACADNSEIATESLKKAALQTYEEKAAECKVQYPERVGNYYKLALCNDSALLTMSAITNPDRVPYIEKSLKARDDISQKEDSGALSKEDADLLIKRSSSELYAMYRSDKDKKDQEIRERNNEDSSNFYHALAIAAVMNRPQHTQTSCTSTLWGMGDFRSINTNCSN